MLAPLFCCSLSLTSSIHPSLVPCIQSLDFLQEWISTMFPPCTVRSHHSVRSQVLFSSWGGGNIVPTRVFWKNILAYSKSGVYKQFLVCVPFLMGNLCFCPCSGKWKCERGGFTYPQNPVPGRSRTVPE